MAAHLNQADGGPLLVTWLNHWSVQQVLASHRSTKVLDQAIIGIDGLLLAHLMGHSSAQRTSADLVLPRLLRLCQGRRLLVIGGHPWRVSSAARELAREGDPTSLTSVDGYAGLEAHRGSWHQLLAHGPDIVVLGLGAPLQEEIASEIAAAAGTQSRLILTCGGFLDQVTQANYYPSWAYRLRLNWLIRLAREPRRLWRRYTLDAIKAISSRDEIRKRISSASGYSRYLEIVGLKASA